MKKVFIILLGLSGCVTEQEDKGVRILLTTMDDYIEREDNPGTYLYGLDSIYITIFKDRTFVLDTVWKTEAYWEDRLQKTLALEDSIYFAKYGTHK